MNRPAGYGFTNEYSFNQYDLIYGYFCPSCSYFDRNTYNNVANETERCINCGKISLFASYDEVKRYSNPSYKLDISGLYSVQNKFNAVKDIDYFEASKYCIMPMSVFDYYGKKDFSLLFNRIPCFIYSRIGGNNLYSSCVLLNTLAGIDFYTLESLKNITMIEMLLYLKDKITILERGYPNKKLLWLKYFLFRAAYLNVNVLYHGLKGIELEIYEHIFHKDKNNNGTYDSVRFSSFLKGNYEI